jgi:hypothetical protein
MAKTTRKKSNTPADMPTDGQVGMDRDLVDEEGISPEFGAMDPARESAFAASESASRKKHPEKEAPYQPVKKMETPRATEKQPVKKDFETGCCPRFDPQPWQGKVHKWKDKLFVKDTLRCFFYIPFGMDKVMAKNVALMDKAGAKNPECIMLYDARSPFAANIYIAVDKEVPHTRMVTITGTYLTRVFEGDYSKTGAWSKEMHEYVKKKGKKLKKLYFSYTTCPK